MPLNEGDAKPQIKKWLVITLAIVVLLIGGGITAYVLGVFGALFPPEETPTPTPTPVSTPPEEPPPPLPDWPLTGVRGEVVERAALVVKVENSEGSRPHEGLQEADIVFEQMVEGGISRLIAIYHSTIPTQIAPIRSVRPMDGPIAAWTHGVLAFSGGQWQFTERAEGLGLQLVSYDFGDDGFDWVDWRPSPHDLSGDPAVFLEQADGDHQASPIRFCEIDMDEVGGTAQRQGSMTTSIMVEISTVATPHWQWDPAGTRWLRFEDDDPALTVEGDQLSATNVLVLEVDVRYLSLTDSAGSRIPEMIVVGEGPGLVATGGRSAEITWKKDSEGGPWRFYDASGAPVVLAPGNTWVELVPQSGTWTVS